MGKNEVLMLFLLSFSYLTPSTAPKLRRCCHCSSPCGCLQALTWKSGWQLSVLQIQREAQGSAKQDACRIYLLQSALPSSLHNPLMQWAKRHLALLWNRNGSRKTGFNARSNQRERAIEARRELPMPVSLEVMSTRTAGKGLRRLGVPLDRQKTKKKNICRVYFENPLSSPVTAQCLSLSGLSCPCRSALKGVSPGSSVAGGGRAEAPQNPSRGQQRCILTRSSLAPVSVAAPCRRGQISNWVIGAVCSQSALPCFWEHFHQGTK